jgi:4-oxalocrotonate tautomerase
MPLTSIALRQGKPAAYRRAVAEGVHEALVEALGIPRDDRFQLVTEFRSENLIYDPHFLGIERTDDIVIIRITLRKGRSRAVRTRLHELIVRRLSSWPGLRPEDVFICLVENDYADWSAGRGEAPLMKLLDVS